MADISDFTDPLVAEIYAAYERKFGNEAPRPYLGASIIGRECKRALWYGLRWARQEQFDGRKLRLFQTGHLSEPRFIEDLRSTGATVYDRDPATGKQFSFSDLGGHFRGNMDGAGTKLPGAGQKWCVLEFKTHSSKSFTELKKHGVMKAKPEHWTQMNTYMGWSGMERSIYLAVNKDTDELHSERLPFDPVFFEKTRAKAEEIIFGGTPPARISDDPKFYICGMCPQKDVCHGNQVPNLSCRTCVHTTPEREGDGRWSCAQHPEGRASTIPIHVQREGCPAHLPLPFLLTYAEAVDAGHGWIEFKRKDTGATFHVAVEGVTPPGPPAPTYTSKEIAAVKDYRILCDQQVEEFKTEFPGSRLVG